MEGVEVAIFAQDVLFLWQMWEEELGDRMTRSAEESQLKLNTEEQCKPKT